jgi:hypothetical protein
MDEERDKLWDYLLENNLASEEALQLVTNINGFSLETLESVLYSATGYHTLEQLQEEEE